MCTALRYPEFAHNVHTRIQTKQGERETALKEYNNAVFIFFSDMYCITNVSRVFGKETFTIYITNICSDREALSGPYLLYLICILKPMYLPINTHVLLTFIVYSENFSTNYNTNYQLLTILKFGLKITTNLFTYVHCTLMYLTYSACVAELYQR